MWLTLAAVLVGIAPESDLGSRIQLDPEAAAARFSSGTLGLVISPGAGEPDLSGLTPKQTIREPGSLVASCVGQPLCDAIPWSSAPPVGIRPLLQADGSWKTLVEVDGQPLLLERNRVLVFTAHLGHDSNERLRMWPYFNFLLRLLGDRAVERPSPKFSQWQYAPVPQRGVAVVLVVACVLLWVGTLAAFVYSRRLSRRRPDLLDAHFLAAPTSGKSSWQEVSFARPLAGLLTLCGALIVFFVPYMWLTNVLIPNRIQPFPEAKGAWEWTVQTLTLFRFLFDAGTFVAFIKYFAEYRLKDPREAVRCAQFFVWWQIGTGLVQLSVAILCSTTLLLDSQYGSMAYLVLLNGVIEYPGFLGFFTIFFMAYQRYDLNIGLDLLADWLLRHLLAIPFVLLFREWGRGDLVIGESMGAAIGLGVGYSVSNLAVFALGYVLYRRLKLPLGSLLCAHFGLATAKRMLSYGVRVVLGKAIFRAAKFFEALMVSLYLAGYPFWMGIKFQIYWHLTFLLPIAYRAFEGATAAFSEAHGNGKIVLTQYYVVRFLQLGALYTAIVASFLLALGPAFVRGVMDPQWQTIAGFLTIAIVSVVLDTPAWVSDMLQKGSGRPGLFAVTLGVEQAMRIALMRLLLPTFGLAGVYIAIAVTISTKCIISWWINHRLIVPLKLYPWPMFVAPALAGLINFGLLRTGITIVGELSRSATMGVFFFGGVVSFPVVFFLAGGLGSFDERIRGELRQASELATWVRPLARGLAAAADAGSRLSPFGARADISIAAKAHAEAKALTQEGRNLSS